MELKENIQAMICIYCRNTITETNSSIEHVFPESFGCPASFGIKCVCRKCNNELGGTVDRVLAGDCMEGLWRLQNIGSKSKKYIKQARVKLNVPDEKKFSMFAGAVVFVDFTKIDCIYLPMQIMIQDGNNKSIYLYEELDKKNVRGKIKASRENIVILAHNTKEFEILKHKLKIIGIKTDNNSHSLPENILDNDGKLNIAAEFIVDDFVYRGIAKIAFNYLAKIHTCQYALDQKFDVIREFIRTGRKIDTGLVQIKQGHILAEETDDKYFFKGHLFTLQIHENIIISRLSLTNQYNFYYEIKLGAMGIIWHDLKSGHAYSFREEKILDLYSPTFLAKRGFVIPKYRV